MNKYLLVLLLASSTVIAKSKDAPYDLLFTNFDQKYSVSDPVRNKDGTIRLDVYKESMNPKVDTYTFYSYQFDCDNEQATAYIFNVNKKTNAMTGPTANQMQYDGKWSLVPRQTITHKLLDYACNPLVLKK